ncbi:hypothetical protein PAMA_003513 [Pampus argenteus]
MLWRSRIIPTRFGNIGLQQHASGATYSSIYSPHLVAGSRPAAAAAGPETETPLPMVQKCRPGSSVSITVRVPPGASLLNVRRLAAQEESSTVTPAAKLFYYLMSTGHGRRCVNAELPGDVIAQLTSTLELAVKD